MSATVAPVALIFGAGVNIGAALVKAFANAGYRVAAVCRTNTAAAEVAGAHLSLSADLSGPAAIPLVFARVRSVLHAFPSVIVWNAATLTPSPDKTNIFSVPVADLEKDLAVAVTGPWAAADEAVRGWREREGERGVFIYTGNIMAKAVFPHPDFTTLGTAKRAASYVVEAADVAYKAKGWRFYYADERTPEGKPMGHTPDAASHAAMYLQLAQDRTGKFPTYVTFAQGEYKVFERPGPK